MTKEQDAVVAACRQLYTLVLDNIEISPMDGSILVIVLDKDGRRTPLIVQKDGTTSSHWYGRVPVALYGGMPKDPEKQKTWGEGLPKHAKAILEATE